MDRNIRSVEDVLRLLDGLFARDAGSSWWDGFYADRAKPVPFFVAKPDENLVSYLDRGLIEARRVPTSRRVSPHFPQGEFPLPGG